MNIPSFHWQSLKRSHLKNDTVVVFAVQDEDPVLLGVGSHEKNRAIAARAKLDGFRAQEREILLVHPPEAHLAERWLLLGLGHKSEVTGETLRRAGGALVSPPSPPFSPSSSHALRYAPDRRCPRRSGRPS